MASIRALPHQTRGLFLTHGGIETSLIFDDGLDLPHFAAFHLLRDGVGRAALTRYYGRYLSIAREFRLGFILESPTWRANFDWADRLGYSKAELATSHADAIALMHMLRSRYEAPETPILVSGSVGPRRDSYVVTDIMDSESAEAYHDEQIGAMTKAGCDVITAVTMTNVPEAIGIARAATRHDVPCVISFTVETGGRLPSGVPLEWAIAEVDLATAAGPTFYMINCAHPSHFAAVLHGGPAWTRRLAGLRADASPKSRAELKAVTELDRGELEALAADYVTLAAALPELRVFGGCCGTDHRHVRAMASALAALGAR